MSWLNKSNSIKKFKKKQGISSYSARAYSNPYFSKKTRPDIINISGIKTKTKIILISFPVLILSIFFILIYSSYFTIKNINLKGEGRIPEINIETIVHEQINSSFFAFWPQKNIFLFSKKKLHNILNEKYSFNNLEITKKLPNTININYQEKEYAFIWQENDEYFYSDKLGYIISTANPLEISQKDYPIIQNEGSKRISEQIAPINSNDIDFIIQLFSIFKNYKNDFVVNRFRVNDELNTIKVSLNEGPELIFDSTESSEEQINKLVLLRTEKLKENFLQKTYIDLRFGDRVYYR